MIMKNDKKNIIEEKYFPIITEAVGRARAYTNEKLKSISWLMVGVVIVCFLAFIQLVVDSFHINNATYKEYSQRTESVETMQKVNQELLDQNKKNQEIIIDLLQKQNLKK
jgi:hypothetical protein